MEVAYQFLEAPNDVVSTRFATDDVERLEAELSAAIARINAGDFRPTPSEFACSDCPALDLVCAGPRLDLRVVSLGAVRVAALYDIHGNLPALEAVLREVDAEDVDAIVVGGDVLWGPLQAECLALLRERDARFLSGNCEDDVLAAVNDSSRWCREQLSEEELAFVAGWPFSLELELDGLGQVVFCHASPRSKVENLTRLTPARDLGAALADVDADLVVHGHTHVQSDRRLPDLPWLVNAGSVGLPYEGRPGAYWTLVDADIHQRRTFYDVDAALDVLAGTGFPDALDIFGESLRGEVSAESATAHFESKRDSLAQ